jgi:hypothetical protein
MEVKVGENTITHLRSAKENNAIAVKRAEENAELARIATEDAERAAQEKAVTLLTIIGKAIDKAAEKGETSIFFNWTTERPYSNDIKIEDWEKCSKYFLPELEALGYKHNFYRYSDSWIRKSGKIAFGDISW